MSGQLLMLTTCHPRYYEQQRHLDTATLNAAKDEDRRKEREAAERAAERAMLEGIVRADTARQLAAVRADEEVRTRPVRQADDVMRADEEYQGPG